jgi:hypothetical protein
MSDTPKVGDYVVLNEDYADVMTTCLVKHVYKNGNLYARSDDGHVSWRGAADAFKVVQSS